MSSRNLMVMQVIMFILIGGTLSAGNSEIALEQKTRLLLEPEMQDAFYGKVDRIYLNGFWKFKKEVNFLKQQGGKIVQAVANTENPTTDTGLAKEYYKPEYDVSTLDEIPVPWPWNVSFPRADTDKPIFDKLPFAGVGYYRMTFEIPQSKKGKKVFLQFDSVQTECKVWVNGKLAGTHRNFRSEAGPPWTIDEELWSEDFELDITSLVNFDGKNTLTLRVYDDGLPIYNERAPDD